jgi:hypothetical protein
MIKGLNPLKSLLNTTIKQIIKIYGNDVYSVDN